ncbi:MAG: hypothetical protein AB7G80_01160 [Dongiaceae bacterium]
MRVTDLESETILVPPTRLLAWEKETYPGEAQEAGVATPNDIAAMPWFDAMLHFQATLSAIYALLLNDLAQAPPRKMKAGQKQALRDTLDAIRPQLEGCHDRYLEDYNRAALDLGQRLTEKNLPPHLEMASSAFVWVGKSSSQRQRTYLFWRNQEAIANLGRAVSHSLHPEIFNSTQFYKNWRAQHARGGR